MTESAAPGGAFRTLSDDDFAVPTSDRYFDDYVPGAVYEYGSITVDEAEIIDFAEQFDAQPIHVDPEFAAAGPFGGVIASGWHSTALMMRLLVDRYISRVASLASPGVDEVRWSAPVRPGDTLRVRVSILEARPSRSKTDRGTVVARAELLNQDDIVAASFVAMTIFAKRPGA